VKLSFQEIGDGFWGELSYLKQKIPTISFTNVGKDVEDLLKAIYELIKSKPWITIPEMSHELDINSRTAERYIAKLKLMKIIERNGGKKAGNWKIKKQFLK
jgi:predicted HTH transcriptional regulator